MQIVVTGGAGFIGSHLVDALLAQPGNTIVVADNLRRGKIDHLQHHFSNPRLHVLIGDIRDPRFVDEVLRGAELVYHLAAQSNVMGSVSDPRYSFETNVTGTYNVLEGAVRYGVRRVIFSSSREAYGEPRTLPVGEDHPLNPKNMYGASKASGEFYCRSFADQNDLDVTILRFANVYGPRDTDRVIPLWIERAAAGNPLLLYGGEQVLDFVWVDRAVETLMRTARLPDGTAPINVGSGRGSTLRSLATRVTDLYGSTSTVQVLPARSAEVTRFVADVGRMRDVLGLEPAADPLAELERMIPRRGAGVVQR